jgi:hypothetical protein
MELRDTTYAWSWPCRKDFSRDVDRKGEYLAFDLRHERSIEDRTEGLKGLAW